MSSKILFLKYVPHLLRGDETQQQKSLRAAANCPTAQKTTVVLNKRGNSLSIQGYPEVPCKEKYTCWSLLQQAVKQLLGIPVNRSIVIRFSEAPFSAISSLSEIFQEPSHIINLIASPLPGPPSTQSNNFQMFGSEEQTDFAGYSASHTKDPYCQYKEMFHSNKQTGKSPIVNVQRKCDFAEMARLLSQLDEVSLTLERTQKECDKIAARCGPSKQKNVPVTNTDLQAKSLLVASDSGKGSSTDSSDSDHTDGEYVKTNSFHTAEDRKVERLLELAESFRATEPEDSHHIVSHDSTDDDRVCLPDSPTDVTVQASFREGGVYVMWNPVRLDGSDMNHGHTVLGYMVYVDKHLKAKVSGPLSSQIELVNNLKESQEYTVQVCTHTNHCNSLLSSPLKYRHTVTSQAIKKHKKTSTIKQQEHKSKAARVESWLLSGHISPPKPHSLAEDVRGSVSNSVTPSPSHHVHFAPGIVHDSNYFNQWTADHPLHLTDIGTHLIDSGCEDTRSTGSSHTSGIVTDFPMSPNRKQPPCLHCNHTNSDTHSFSDVHHSNLHLCSDDGFHTLTRCACQEESNGLATKSSSVSSTLCPSLRLSRASSTNTCSSDTLIDEPVEFDQPKSKTAGVKGAEHPKGRILGRTFYKMRQKRPEPPENLCVFHAPGEHRWLILEWSPVSRDSKGCSNGFFVLGYRIYVNDVDHQSVDGAMTCQAKIRCPSNPSTNKIKIDIRSRAMAGESVSSNSVFFDLRTHSHGPAQQLSRQLNAHEQLPYSKSSSQTSAKGTHRAETYV